MNPMPMTPDQIETVQRHAALAAFALHHGAPAYACDVQPGNGTRYVMVLTSLEHAHGNPAVIGGIEDNYVLSLPYFQTSYPVNLPGYFTEDYVAAKWTNRNTTDGVVVAEFLNYASARIRDARLAPVED